MCEKVMVVNDGKLFGDITAVSITIGPEVCGAVWCIAIQRFVPGGEGKGRRGRRGKLFFFLFQRLGNRIESSRLACFAVDMPTFVRAIDVLGGLM